MSIGEGAGTGLATMRGRNYPTIRQFTVFLENRVGQLLEVIRRFEGSRVRIVALSINDATECAFVRFLLSHPEQGREILERAGLTIVESDLIGLELPERSNPLLEVCTALLQAEVNIIQAYPLTIRDAIEERTGRAVARAAVFITLERLERKGFLKSRYGDPTPVRGGRAKRFFKATPRGVAAARASVQVVTAMTAGVELL